jgi:sigma-B regulation protein RsbU (phosphoserine phosphatase)
VLSEQGIAAGNDGMTPATEGVDTSRLWLIDDLVKEMSAQNDADRLVDVFARKGDFLVHRDTWLTLTRRDLHAPFYRVTRSRIWPDSLNTLTSFNSHPILDRGLLGELLYVGRPALLNRLELAPDDPGREHLAGMQSLACTPTYDHGQPTNMLLVARRQADSFTTADVESLMLHGNLLGRAVAHLTLARQLEEAYRQLDDEMQQAGRVQRELLPSKLPDIDGLELGASYVTSSRAGGDYYHAIPLPDGRCGLFLADVSGHGVAAAVGMAMVHTLLQSCPEPAASPSRIFAHVNRHLMRVAPRGMFATAWYGIYDPAHRRLDYSVAGHPPPMLRCGPEVRELETTRGLPLGVDEDDTWTEAATTLRPGDVLLLYTDGLIEGANAAGEPFGKDRVAEALRLAPIRAARIVQHVDRYFRHFRGEGPDLDDRTLLAAVAVP